MLVCVQSCLSSFRRDSELHGHVALLDFADPRFFSFSFQAELLIGHKMRETSYQTT